MPPWPSFHNEIEKGIRRTRSDAFLRSRLIKTTTATAYGIHEKRGGEAVTNWLDAESTLPMQTAERWERRYMGRIRMGKAGRAFGRFLVSPAVLWTVAGLAGSSIVNHLTNYQLNQMRYNKEAMRRLREIELGGFLEAGYLTQAAATDRQRLVQAMADSNFNGRSFIGNEAMFYRNTF